MLTLDNLLTQTPIPATFEAGLQHLCHCSLVAKRLLSSNVLLLEDLLQNYQQSYSASAMQGFLNASLITDETTLKKALRQLRQRVFLRMMYRDLNGLADLAEIVQTTSHMAEVTVNHAIHFHHDLLATQYGEPLSESGVPQQLIVVGMGKLGGYELNVSSDIDLIFSYEEKGETDGLTRISNVDFFTRLAKKLISAIDDITEDGFVFRVDMRLRPFGSEGALVSSLDALEEYYQNHGREWERYAWIKGRVISNNGEKLEKLLKPFVFRKYLDFGAFASMRDLKVQIQRDVNSKGMQDNIKLGRGGIREIEFIAQVFQLIRGGQDASLQIKPTLQVLDLLALKKMCPQKTVKLLRESYTFLRNLEHRLMYVDDAQTQALPKSDEARARIAKAMGFTDWPAFLDGLNAHRQIVQLHFDETFSDASEGNNTLDTEKALWDGALSQAEAVTALQSLGFDEPPATINTLNTLHQSTRYKQLPELSRQRFNALMPHVIRLSGTMPNAQITLTRVIDLLESICRRASYLALLAEHTNAMDLLIKLCSSSPWLANYLAQHPILLDELLDTRNLYSPPDFAQMQQELSARMKQADGDVEQQMDMMRHFKHAHIFRFAAQDIAGELPLETLSDYLSALAELILNVSLQTIWPNVRGHHLAVPKFAVIGYGKLGGKELGYASDLDIIFLYDDESADAGEIYARFAQRINNWFNSLTAAGLLYETDLQLRPDGNSGLLVSSVSAFRDYQLSKAWVWEHQAITRARFVAGDSSIGKAFEAIRVAVLAQTREREKLKTEVVTMRNKMRAASKKTTSLFELKNGVGGIIDVEFLVQFLVLAHAKQHPKLTENRGNIALLKLLASLSIIEADPAENVAEAYRQYRKMQHALKLQGVMQTKVEAELVKEHVIAVTELWKKVFA